MGTTTAWIATPTEAADYARQTGFALFPAELKYDGGKWLKRPRFGCRWKDESTSDPEAVTALWQRHAVHGDPDQKSMIAIHCGKSGIFVVDVDYPDRVPDDLKLALEKSQATTHVRASVTRATPHVYYRQPEGLPVLDSAFPGGEIKGDGFVAVSTQVVSSVPPTQAPEAVMAWTTRGPTEIIDGTGKHVRYRLDGSKLDSWVTVNQREPRISDTSTFLVRPIEKFWQRVNSGEHRRQACRGTSTTLFIEAMAGCYKLEDGISALLDAYRTSRESTPLNGWNAQRLQDYKTMWTTLINHYESGIPIRVSGKDVNLQEAVEEKMAELAGWGVDAISWDPENDEADADMMEMIDLLRVAAGEAPAAGKWESLDEDVSRRLLGATDSDLETSTVTPAPAAIPSSTTPQEARDPGPGPTPAEPEPRAPEASTGPETAPPAPEPAIQSVEDAEEAEWRPEWADEPHEPPTPTETLEPAKGGYEAMRAKILESSRGDVARRLKQRFIDDIATQEFRDLRDHRPEIVGEMLEIDWIEVPPPDLLLRTDKVGLFRTGGTSALLVGDKGGGKSTLAAQLASDVLNIGGRVAWIDLEQGRQRVIGAFATLLVNRRAAAERLMLIDLYSSGGSLTDATRVINAQTEPFDLVVVDSVARAVVAGAVNSGGPADGAEDSSASFIDMVNRFVNPLTGAGTSVLMIDHVGHGDKTRARGSSAKGQQVDMEFTARTLCGWSRNQAGAIELTCRKDRGGYYSADEIAAVIEYTPDLSIPDVMKRPLKINILAPTDTTAMSWLAEGEEQGEKERDAKKVRHQERKLAEIEPVILEVLTTTGSSTNSVYQTVRKTFTAGRGTVNDALHKMLEQGLVEHDVGAGNAELWSLPKPLDEIDG